VSGRPSKAKVRLERSGRISRIVARGPSAVGMTKTAVTSGGATVGGSGGGAAVAAHASAPIAAAGPIAGSWPDQPDAIPALTPAAGDAAGASTAISPPTTDGS